MPKLFSRLNSLFLKSSLLQQQFDLYFKRQCFNLKRINFKYQSNNHNNSHRSQQLRKGYITGIAACGLFTWDEYRITNDEVKAEINEILTTFKMSDQQTSAKRIDFELSRQFEGNNWQKIYDKKDLIIWRREIVVDDTELSTHADYDLFEYKVLGRIHDITPIEYYQTQIDLEYRKEWDYLVILIEMIDKDVCSNSELVRWITKFPYPLSPREYIYARRCCIEPDEKLMILISRGLPECEIPQKVVRDEHKNCVNVTKYKSNMIIIPYTDFDKPGLDYIIQYYDINKAKIPKFAFKWMATSGLPDYVEKLHKATLKLTEKNNKLNHLDKNNILNSFEMFYLNSPIDTEEIEDLKTDSDEHVALDPVIQIDSTVVEILNEIENKIDLEIETTLQNSEGNVEAISNKDEIEKRKFIMSIVKKLNEDYFDDYEPHPHFYHY